MGLRETILQRRAWWDQKNRTKMRIYRAGAWACKRTASAFQQSKAQIIGESQRSKEPDRQCSANPVLTG